MFHSTLPAKSTTAFLPTDLPSTLCDGTEGPLSGEGRGPSTLSPSVLHDLQRYSEKPLSAQLLPVVAASMRHGKALSLAVDFDGRLVKVTLHPRRHLYYGDLDLCALPDQSFLRIKLIAVEPDADVERLLDARQHIGSLRPLLWHLALRGAFSDLLPELAGDVRCRVTLGVTLTGLPVDGAIRRLVQRMKSEPRSIEELLTATPLSRVTTQRVWNALYLQSALMVSRRVT